MPPAEHSYALKLEVELAHPADQRELDELEIYLRQYATELCAGLGLPVGVSLSLNPVNPETINQPGLFRILVNDQACRSRWWPQPILPDDPSAQDLGELIALALYDCRELLLTSDLADLIAAEWQITSGNGSVKQRSREGFPHFLRAFLKYNFSLRHARRLVQTCRAGASSESEAAYSFEQALAAYSFEQALEEATDLAFGPAVTLSQEEYDKPEYGERFKSLMKNLGDDLGLVLPEVRIQGGLLKPGEFQIQLNDIRLPVIRGLSRGEILLLEKPSAASKLGIKTIQLFDPLLGLWALCAKDSPETKKKVKVWPGGPADDLKGSLRLAILANAGSLLVSPMVHLLLEHLKKSASNLVKSVRAKFGESPPFHRRLTTILRRLLDEQVPISDLAGILESLLSLREVSHNGTRRRVYHFSELPDSPLLVADDKPLAALSADDFAFAARLGARSLSVRKIDNVVRTIPVLPLAPGLETAISSRRGAGVFSQEQGKQIFELLNAEPSQYLAVVVSQELRAAIRELLRFEFPTVSVLGTSEIPVSTLAEAYNTAGKTLVDGKRYNEALEMVLKAASLQPEESIYHYNLGGIYQALDRPEDANVEYQLAGQVANDLRWRAAVADTFFDRKAYEYAIPLYDEVLRDSKNAHYFYRLGFSLSAVAAFRRAIEAYRQAILLVPEEAVYHANLANALTSQGEYMTGAAQKRKHYCDAVEEYQQAIAINRDTAWYHHYLSLPLIRLSRFEEASEELREAIRLDPKNVIARRELADCLCWQEKFDEAVHELEASKEAYPSILEIQMDLAKAYAQAGQYAQAVSLAEGISTVENPPEKATEFLTALRNAQETAGKLSIKSENAELFAALGQIHFQLGNLQAAVAQYRRAATLDPATPDYHKWLGNMLFKEDDWQGAASEWEKVVAQATDDALTFNNLGTAYDGLEQNQKAMICYQNASSLAPGNFVPQYNLGSSNYRLGNLEEARDAYQKAAELNDKFPPAHLNLGNCYYRLRQPDKAIAEWQRAITLDPKYVDALFNLGVALWATGDATDESRQNAVKYWKDALRLDRNLTVAEDNLQAVAQAREPDLAIFDLLRSR